MRPAKRDLGSQHGTQIKHLIIRFVTFEYIKPVNTFCKQISPNLNDKWAVSWKKGLQTYANNKASVKPVHLHSLARSFAVCLKFY